MLIAALYESAIGIRCEAQPPPKKKAWIPQAAAPKGRGKTMVKTYRDVAIEQMIATVEEAMSQAIDWWGDLPPSMKEAIEQFRTQLGVAIDSVEFVKRALDRQVHETDHGQGRA